TFVLGASTWRIADITPSQVLVTPAPGEPGRIAFWHGDALGRPIEVGRAVGKLVRELRSQDDEASLQRLRDRSRFDDRAARNLLDPEEVHALVQNQVHDSALFASRFRENAGRALLLPRRRPGERTPLWQQRQRSANLLRVASKHPSFPILMETYRECLKDVFDM